MWSELRNLWAPLFLGLLEVRQEFRSLFAYMVVHRMVVQERSRGLLPRGEHVASLRDVIGHLDGNLFAFAFPMLMLLLPDAGNAFA